MTDVVRVGETHASVLANSPFTSAVFISTAWRAADCPETSTVWERSLPLSAARPVNQVPAAGGPAHWHSAWRDVTGDGRERCFLVVILTLLLQDVKYIQTDGYRAPEAELQNCLAQAGLQSDAECTSAVDLWSLGIILLEMFSGMKLKHTVRSQEWKVPRRAWCGGQGSARRASGRGLCLGPRAPSCSCTSGSSPQGQLPAWSQCVLVSQ